ncbi:MAG: hypothetical protein ACREN5_15670 [Gemmatimonadales bacterium]
MNLFSRFRAERAEDPICGRTLKTEDAPLHIEEDGREVYFCSVECLSRHRFRAAVAASR